MRHQTFGVLTAGAVLSAAILSAQPAAAVPVSNLSAAAEQLSTTQSVAWVCGPFRCWWTPRYRYYAPVVVAPRAYYGYPAYGYRLTAMVPTTAIASFVPAWGSCARGYYRRW